jgi:hypothetical protein
VPPEMVRSEAARTVAVDGEGVPPPPDEPDPPSANRLASEKEASKIDLFI